MDLDNVTSKEVRDSLSLEDNRGQVFSAGEGAGASGSFFFFSKDKKFIIKTLRGKEKDTVLNLVDSFILHLQKAKNKSFIAKIYGVFTIKTTMYAPLDFIVMQNTASMIDPSNWSVKFDMKGSTYNRKVRLTNKFWNK